MPIKRDDLYRWQLEGFDAWKSSGYGGVVKAPTGVGKTMFAMYCIQELRVSTIIVVPTQVLMRQWKKRLISVLGIPKDKVGLYYGKQKQMRPITIAVINSIRPKDLSMFDMFVGDEVHRYSSSENIKPIQNSDFRFILGMTAWVDEKVKHKELIGLMGGMCYRYTEKQAREDDLINSFDLINVRTDLSDDERFSYERCDKEFREKLEQFGMNMTEMQKVAATEGHKERWSAVKGLKNMAERRKTFSNASSKMLRLLEIVSRHINDKIIIFNEFTEMADNIKKTLESFGVSCMVYHSKKKSEDAVERFENNQCRILITAKALNEGLDVGDANVGIIVSGNKSESDMKQRVGRVIRKAEGKNAYVYQIYCTNTIETNDARMRQAYVSSYCNNVMFLDAHTRPLPGFDNFLFLGGVCSQDGIDIEGQRYKFVQGKLIKI